MMGFSPKVQIIAVTSEPQVALATAAARTCILGPVMPVVSPSETERDLTRRLDLARSLTHAGHNTTFQHHTITFALDNVSRQFVWQFLHSHPFYNSEQVSQRYVKLDPQGFVRPPFEPPELSLFERTVERLFVAYEEIAEGLLPITRSELLQRFPRFRSQSHAKRFEREARRKAQEIARYVVPVAAKTGLYHTISTITLLRYCMASQASGTTDEQCAVMAELRRLAISLDPELASVADEPIPLERTAEYLYTANPPERSTIEGLRQEFDVSLAGKVSQLLPGAEQNEQILADAVRGVLSLPRAALDDVAAIRLAMDAARNPSVGTSANVTTLFPITRAMQVVDYRFRKRLSHAADSQDQRHRMTPAARPVLFLETGTGPDYVVPELVRRAGGAVEKLYADAMNVAWDAMDTLLRRGAKPEHAAYLFPNAKNIRFIESGSLLDLQHKHTMRQCLNAQEEIWRATMEEAAQIRAINPTIGSFLLPPCGHRCAAKKTPYCPEGDRFCGISVWRLSQDDFQTYVAKRTI